ncbi:MAG: CBS domain-containing protein [Deltaproteobacteria bacterium]|nr:CBS domain-containing protein [Deltaproteobacteria bacterium]
MIRAKHIMSKKLLTVTEGTNIRHVMKLLSENRVTGLPVVSEDMSLLGIVTEKDILEVLLYGKDIKSKTAGDLMATDIVSFEEDEDLMTIFRTLVEGNFRRVPILSDGKLMGIISRTDIINFLAEKSNEIA